MRDASGGQPTFLPSGTAYAHELIAQSGNVIYFLSLNDSMYTVNAANDTAVLTAMVNALNNYK